ncbi:T9SS type A sorting domain-containing protein [Lacinutrix undariae]
MKQIYLFLFALTALNASAQTTIDFDTAENWSSGSSYDSYTYSEGLFSFASENNYQESGSRTFGNEGLASRLNKSSNSELTATIASGGVNTFSVLISAWDNSPSPNFNLDYSVDGGTSWTDVATINNESLNDDTEYVSFGATIANAADNIMVRIKSNGTTERIIVDNFTWTGFSSDCEVTFNTATYACETNTIGDDNDTVTISIPYSGVDANITSVTTTTTGTVAGDNPATVENGTVTISGLSEGDSWNVNLVGGDCGAISASGVVPADNCDPTQNTCFDISNGTEKFEMFDAETTTSWEETNGTYSANGYCGGGCENAIDGWLVFGPLDVTGVSDLALKFDAIKAYSETALTVNYTSNYIGCPTNTTWSVAQTLTSSDSYEIDLSAATGTQIYVGIQYLDDGADGYSEWDLSNVELATYGACPVLGTRTVADCSTLSNIDVEATNFAIYPNPTTTGSVNIISAQAGTVEVSIFDILGKQVISQTVNNNTLNVSQLNAGVYIVKISQNNTSVTKKLIVK